MFLITIGILAHSEILSPIRKGFFYHTASSLSANQIVMILLIGQLRKSVVQVMCFGINRTKGVVMKSRTPLMNWLLSSLCVLTLVWVTFILYKGIVLFYAHEHNKFLSTYNGILVGHNLADVSKLLGKKPAYDVEMTADNINYVISCGLNSLPPLDDYSELRVAAFTWAGVPHRYIFVFYSHTESNIVAKAHGKM